jgi:SAM-dependent MidA family methyltransferase
MSRPVMRAVREAIEANGPITFAEYMELALYGPGGFYERPRVGVDADFVTSPHVHPIFAGLLARALTDIHEALEQPDPFRVTEVGAGDGTLARQVLASLEGLPVEYHAVEVGRGRRTQLEQLLGPGAVSTTLDPPVDVVVANELLDNLPFRVIRGRREVCVGIDEDRLVEVLAPLGEQLHRFTRADHADDVVVPIGAFAFVDRLASVLERGYAILIDYGQVGTAGGPVHGYREHGLVADVLASPGDTDVTAGVDVSLIEEHARPAGLNVFPSVTQTEALRALGFGGWMHEELAHQHKQLETRDGSGAVRTWSGRSRATLLVDPAGLGRLRWIVLASTGLPEPAWLTAARARRTRPGSIGRSDH